MSEIAFLSISELARRIRSGELTAVGVTEYFLERIDRLNPRWNAFVLVDHEGALRRAAELDRMAAKGIFAGALHGVPVAIKDDIPTVDYPTTYGSKLFRDWRPPQDASLVHILKGSGVVVLGKTNLDEFSFGVLTVNPLFGQTRNPYDPARIPGGSSGGSAVAVSCGLCAAALGSDSAGSLRLPAAACGVVALKPSRGILSSYGVTPVQSTKGLLGLITRTFDDMYTMYHSLAVPDPLDPATANVAPWQPDGVKPVRPAQYRIGHLLEESLGSDPAVRIASLAAIRRISEAGWRVDVQAMPEPDALVAVSSLVNAVEFLTWIGARVAEVYPGKGWRDKIRDFGPIVAAQLEKNSAIPATDYCRALEFDRPRFLAAYGAIFEKHDFLISPTAGLLPLHSDGLEESGHGFDSYGAGYRDYRRPCEVASFIDYPALTFPIGQTKEGLPLGLQLIGKPGSDQALVNVAAAMQALFPPVSRAPGA